MGLALHNYESSNGAFPPACKSINLTTSPPSVMFPDTGFSVQARILSYIEGGTLYNALNFSYEYNDASGGNFTGASAVDRRLTSARRHPLRSDSRHGVGRPERLAVRDRLRAAATATWTMPRRSTPTSTWSTASWPPAASAPRRSCRTATRLLAAKGLLKDGKTRDQRDHRRHEQHDRDHRVRRPRRAVRQPVLRGPVSASSAGRGPRAAPTARHRFWRWADPGYAFGTSGQPNNKGLPTNEGVPWPTTTATAGNQAGPERGAVSRSTPAASTPSSATARSGSSRTASTWSRSARS